MSYVSSEHADKKAQHFDRISATRYLLQLVGVSDAALPAVVCRDMGAVSFELKTGL